MEFQIIKSKAFTFQKEGKDVKGVAYTIAHKARVIQASTLNFDEGQLVPSEDGKTLNVKGDVELIQSNYTNVTGESVRGIKLVPKMDLAVSML